MYTRSEGKGDAQFFGGPALQVPDWMRVDADSRGCISVLDSTSLIRGPIIYSTFMLWMLGELPTKLPKVGDLEKPKMVFFFDEAHLLFDDAPKTLPDKAEQVVKLIHLKGIGVYSITQSPSGIPGGVLVQLGNKVQHALCAYVPTEQKGVKAATESFRRNPTLSAATAPQELKTAEALVSFLDEGGAPEEVRVASILPPRSKFGTLDAITRQATILASSLHDKYAREVNRESIYEPLLQRVDEQVAATAKAKEETGAEKQAAKEATAAEKRAAKETAAAEKQVTKEVAAAIKQAGKEAAAATREEKEKAVQQKCVFASIGGSVTGTIGRGVGKQFGRSTGGGFGKQLGDNVGASLERGVLKTPLEF